MNITQLRHEIEIDEGNVRKVYRDHLGFPTFGIGHLITSNDPEYRKPIGTKISKARIIEAFSMDVCQVLNDCEKLYPDFYELPEEAQLIIANMMFNMGLTRLSNFRKMKRAIDERDYMEASAEMVDSKWYRQVTNRAIRLVTRMKKVAMDMTWERL